MAMWKQWRDKLFAVLPAAWQPWLLNNVVQRIVAGVVLVPLVLWAIWDTSMVFALMVWGCLILVVREWQRMVEPDNWHSTVHYLYSSVILLAVVQSLLGAGAALVALIILPTFLWLVANMASLRRPLWFAFSILYLSIAPIALLTLQDGYTIGPALLTYYFGVVWATDTAAYVIGKRLGGPLLAPDVSPRKTWSGFIGGLVAGTLVGGTVAAVLGATLHWGMGIALLISAVAQASDLCESGIKRFYSVKDTGSIIPGHGGVLDRVDSILLSAPFFVLLQFIAGRSLPW